MQEKNVQGLDSPTPTPTAFAHAEGTKARPTLGCGPGYSHPLFRARMVVTLASRWLHSLSSQYPSAWYSLDATGPDATPHGFMKTEY